MLTKLRSYVQRLTFLYFLLLIHLKLTSVEASQIKHYFFATYLLLYTVRILKYVHLIEGNRKIDDEKTTLSTNYFH